MSDFEKYLLDKLEAAHEKIGRYKALLKDNGISIDSLEGNERPRMNKETKIIKHNFRIPTERLNFTKEIVNK